MKKRLFLLISFLASACLEPSESRQEKQTPQIRTDSTHFEPQTPADCSFLVPLGQRSTKLKECSGPYYLDDVVFLNSDRALMLDLSSSEKLPGQKSIKHSTVLFHSAGISNQDLAHAKAIFTDWKKSRSTHGNISFYLTFWTGKKSELIVGELKNLIQTLRQGFPIEKLPSGLRAPIHVELEP